MLNELTLDSIEQSSNNSCLSNTENIFHNSTINVNFNNFDQYSNVSHPSSPFSQYPTQFHFVLNASPSLSTKINEEATTYLNQGQPYELKFYLNKIQKDNNHTISTIDYSLSTTYRSILRLCFWDKVLQQQESELMNKWFNEYQSSSLFDIDMNLTYGILSIICSKQISNAIEIVWDTSSTVSIFIRFKCTSTDFAQKRHGGEKGIPLRIQIDTYHEKNLNHIEHIYSCCCKIQLFRLKGAQRKNKADKIKIEKLNLDQRRQYQTTLEYTILQPCFISPLYTLNLLSLSQPPDDLFDVSTTSLNDDNILKQKEESNEIHTETKDLHQNNNNNIKNFISKITIYSSHEDVINWLNENNFSSILNNFLYYRGIDLLRLSFDNIREICHNNDAISIRLYNQLNETLVYPLKILYIKMIDNDIYSAIYLHTLTRYELIEKLFQLINQPKQNTYNIILELNKIKIKIDDDNVVKYSLPNEGQFYLRIFSDQFNLCLLNNSN